MKFTVVIGGTGKTGRRVADRLRARSVPVRIASRSGTPPFDWNDPTTWVPVLRGAEAAYVAYYPDMAVPGAADRVGAFARTAVENGTRRLILLSGRGENGALLGEKAVQESGADWTILRCSWFNQNFSEGAFLEQVLAGEVMLPAGRVAEPFVDADDIADAAVAALTEDGHIGRLYELTGPRLLTFEEAVGEIAHATGRAIRYVPVSMEQYKALLTSLQVPGDFMSLIEYLFTEVLDGRNAHLTDGVNRALGRAAARLPRVREGDRGRRYMGRAVDGDRHARAGDRAGTVMNGSIEYGIPPHLSLPPFPCPALHVSHGPTNTRS